MGVGCWLTQVVWIPKFAQPFVTKLLRMSQGTEFRIGLGHDCAANVFTGMMPHGRLLAGSDKSSRFPNLHSLLSPGCSECLRAQSSGWALILTVLQISAGEAETLAC